MPLLAPLMAVIALLRLIDAFKMFDTIFLLTGGGPGTATESVSLFAYKTVFDFWDLGTATAIAIVDLGHVLRRSPTSSTRSRGGRSGVF